MSSQHHGPGFGLVHGFWDEAAALVPDRTAVRDSGGAWSYAELATHGRRCARWLHDRGVRRGDRVLVRIGSRRKFAALLYGASRIGAALAPVNALVRPYLLAHMLSDADPALVIVGGGEAPAVSPLTGRPVVEIDAVWPEVSASGLDCPAREPIDRDTALLLYTSGTTAAPKAVVSPHAQVVFAARSIAARLGYRSGDVVFSRLPLSFDYGLYQLFLGAIAGAEVVLAGEGVNAGLLAELCSCDATVVPLVPPLATMLVALAARNPAPAASSGVRLFTNTGSHLPAATVAGLRVRFPGARVVLMFGTTECKRVSITEPDADLDRPGSLGRPLPGTEVLVVDDAGRPLGAGEVGELVVRGPHVMPGYWRAPEASALRFRRSPDTGEVVLHTGDYGWLDADGHVFFEGRRDDIFKRDGVRVSTLEIEAAALDIPGVTQAAVCLREAAPLPVEGVTDEPVLFVAGDRAPGDVIRELATRLEPAKVPRHCHLLDALPTTPNGKIDRSQLAELQTVPGPRA